MKKTLIFVMLFSNIIFAQSKSDSLIALLKTVASDTHKVTLLNQLSKTVLRSDLLKSLSYSEHALKIAEKYRDSNRKVDALNSIASANAYLGKNEIALEYASRSLEIGKQLGYKRGISRSLRWLGFVYLNLANYPKALDYLKQNIPILEEIGDKRFIAQNLHSMAVIFHDAGEYQKSLEYAEKALKIKREVGDKLEIAYSYGIMGSSHRKLGDLENALKSLLSAYEVIQKTEDKLGMIYSLTDIGATLKEKREYEKAIRYLNQGLEIAKEVKAKELQTPIYEYLAEIYEAMGDYKLSLTYFKLYKEYKDFSFNQEKSKQISEIEAKYQNAKREKILERQKIYQNILVASLILLIIMAVLIGQSYRLKKRSAELEHEKNIELQQINQELKQEVDDHRKTENELEKSQRMLRMVMNNIPEAIYWKDCNSVYLGCNHKFAVDAGALSSSDVIGKTDFELAWKKEEANFSLNSDQRVINSDRPEYHVIQPQVKPDGTKVWLERNRIPLHDANGKVVGILGTYEDISQRILVEKALAAEKEHLAVTLRSIGDGVITTDIQGNIILLNKVAEELTGWKQSEAVGKPLSKTFKISDKNTGELIDNPVENVLKKGLAIELTNFIVMVARNGTSRFIDVNVAPINDMDSKVVGTVLAFRDVSEKQKLESELLNAQKLESLGILAGGIAHDFNNILTGILANISYSKVFVEPTSKVVSRLNEAEKACFRAEGLTQQLLTFAKGGIPIKKVSSIEKHVKSAAMFALRGSNVRCEFFIEPDTKAAEVDEGQIAQVINNLVINADQAMPEGGLIKLSVGNEKILPQNKLPLTSGEYVKIIIEDNGIGIPEEHLSKIFDPYFSTKQKGSGLGLATTYSIIKNHSGHIKVDSKVNRGSSFHIYLPATSKPVIAAVDSEIQHFEGHGNILIVDDEQVIIEVTQRMLNHIGYEVLGANDGQECIQKYKEAQTNGKPIDVVILDLTIPGGMGGQETIKQLRKIDPEVKAIVSSGYSNDPIMSNFKKYGFDNFITKPFNIEQLSKVISDVIHNGGE